MASCQYCNNVEKYKYWNELPPTSHKFFKVMVGDYKYQMRIPDKFMDNFRGQISEWCILRGPSNNEWPVKVVRAQRLTFFTDGWMDFVINHGIKERDFLVFTYAGESAFSVSIFDYTACEVESSHFAKPSTSFPHMDCTSVLHEQGMYCVSDNKSHEDACHETTQTTPRAKQRQAFYISNRRPVTPYEMKRAKDCAITFMMKNEPNGLPMIDVTMLRSHVYTGFHLTIPKDWALKHMLTQDHDVELRVPGVAGRWMVGCRWSASMQCHIIPNWSKFVLENNLEEHDVCVFVLSEKIPRGGTDVPLFYVNIFRVLSELVPVTVKRIG